MNIEQSSTQRTYDLPSELANQRAATSTKRDENNRENYNRAYLNVNLLV